MASGGGNFRKIYPPEESVIFDGGLDSKFPRALLPDNESPDCANVVFYNGAVETRDGAVLLNTTAVAPVQFDGLYVRRDNSTAETMCAFINGSMFTLNVTTFLTVPSAQSVFTIGQRVGTDFAENYMFIGNGGAGPYKWDGTTFSQHGIPAPTQTITVASNGVGALSASATYMYKYTYFNSALAESNLSPVVTFVISATSGQNSLTNIGVAPTSAGVSRRRVYRTLANGAVFNKLVDIGDNTTTTFNDNVADIALGAAAPQDNGVPPKYNAIININGILFCNDVANPNFVWYSNVGNPYVFASTNFFKIGDRTSDLVTGFAAYDNSLVVFCEKSVWINYMPNTADPTTWRQLKTNSPYGAKSAYCNLQVLNSVLFPASQDKKFVGFAQLQGLALDPSNTLLTVTNAGSLLQSDRIEPDMFNVQSAFLNQISGIVYKTRAYISVTYGAGATNNNRAYLFDFSINNEQKQQKVSWVPMTGWNPQQFCIYGGNLYFCTADNTGFVYRIDGTGVYSDNGAPINSYFWTKEFPGYESDVNLVKDFRYVNMLIDNAGLFFMSLSYKADSDNGSGTSTQINLAQGGSNWGAMVWGRDLWGGGVAQQEPRIYIAPTRGKRLQLKFSNQNIAGQRFKVYRMNFAYNIKGFR